MMDKLWDPFSTVIKMNDKLVAQAASMAAQQAKIEDLSARVIPLETALEIALSTRGAGGSKRLPRQTETIEPALVSRGLLQSQYLLQNSNRPPVMNKLKRIQVTFDVATQSQAAEFNAAWQEIVARQRSRLNIAAEDLNEIMERARTARRSGLNPP
jgi:hypothetical protein